MSDRCILALNGGSSSIRFALYESDSSPRRVFNGKIDRIGRGVTRLTAQNASGEALADEAIDASDPQAALNQLLDWLQTQSAFSALVAVGHRMVHGMAHREPERVTANLLQSLRQIVPFDPEHLPRELGLIEAFSARHPDVAQVVCFDTEFHRSMPRVASQLPLPRRYEAQGLRRYGFHGLSYAYLIEALARAGDPAARRGRTILAHLGSGASLAAVRDGQSIDTSMGFSPTSGLPMSTRCGDIDPGVLYFLAQHEQFSAEQLQHLLAHESGLIGVSETSADVRDLLARETQDERAKEALDLFCYQTRKWIGAFAAALGGLDALVFSGGIGEKAPIIRARICDGLAFLGVALDQKLNEANQTLISADGARVRIWMIPTDEELMIAKAVIRVLDRAPE